MLIGCLFIQLIILVMAMFNNILLPYTYWLRAIVAIVFLKNVRAYLYDIFIYSKDAMVVLTAIFCYVLFSSILFYTIFKSTF